MNRRDFIKTTVMAGLSVSLPVNLDLLIGNLHALETVDIAVAQGPSPAIITTAAINAIGGIGRFISRGDIVVVKPNIGWDRTPEQAATTNPEVVATIIRLCYEAGAKTVKVFDNPVNDERRCYKQSGIADAARNAGADVSFMDKRKFKDVKLGGLSLKEWPLYTDILEADKVINVPIAKTHGLATLTLGMKNWMGVMGGWRWRIHQRLDKSLVDVAQVIKPTLTILDAVRVLTDNGPQGGSLQDVKRLDTVIAGTDQVAIDSFGATLFGLTGHDLGYVRIGNEAGLGVMDLSRLNIKKIIL
ncbi:MAG TPA: DUF362 domain-containing protein [Syntrophales bacterium]|nr:DUF362 domain-containing protein [Syntrophales bacterium]HPQ43139.1 DUF362 domain-containing protein [Syntrophales bacterium]